MKIVVGSNIDSWCTRCRLMLAHTIEAIAGGKVSRVHCNTCGAQHAYRPAPPGSRPAGAGTAANRRPVRRKADSPQSYETLLNRHDPSAARPYSPNERFRESDLIRHSVFGLGIVTARGENKIQVTFSDRVRTLVHAG